MMNKKISKILAALLGVFLLVSCAQAPRTDPETEEETGPTVTLIDQLPAYDWQVSAAFPQRLGYDDDTLAVNNILSFFTYADQGKVYLEIGEEVSSFDLFIDSEKISHDFQGGNIYELDIGSLTRNGTNSLQVSAIEPKDARQAIKVHIPYPILIEGDPEAEGFNKESFRLISDLIGSDVAYGFPSAQLAIIRHGKLIYNEAWGALNSYAPDGTRITDPIPADNDTLYDLASVTKMFAGNYPLQKLVSEGKLSLEDKVADILGDAFYEDTLAFSYSFGEDVSLATQKEWKASIRIKDLLLHQAGFPPSPRYFNLYVDAPSQEYGSDKENILYSGSDPSEATRQATAEAINKTPLLYEPGTKTLYSDVDYMVIAFIIEKISGLSLDDYLKENFFVPLGLEHICFAPLKQGFSPEDCAATELNGNTRDGAVDFPGVRTYTLQGEVHDEMAYYSMNGVSGHAGLFADAEDLAKLAYVMFSGGYGGHRFFDRDVLDLFTAPDSLKTSNYGLGWYRQADGKRCWYFGSQAASSTIGHQGWTGTLIMIDFARDIVMAYLTNERNTPLRDKEANANDFDGLYYTASTLGFVSELFAIGLDEEADIHDRLVSLLGSMVTDAYELIPKGAGEDHPAYRNYLSKKAVYDKWK